MPSPRLFRSLALGRTDVSEENIASIIRVIRMGELETRLAFFTLMMEALLSSVLTRVTRRNFPDNVILHETNRLQEPEADLQGAEGACICVCSESTVSIALYGLNYPVQCIP
jgi:hypothetical protein